MPISDTFYCNFSPPKGFDIEKRLRHFESLPEARDRTAMLCKVLRNGDKPYWRIVPDLMICKHWSPCGLLPCPNCMRFYRIWIVAEILRLFQGQDLLFVTIVPPRLRFPAGSLSDFEPRNLIERVKRQLERYAPRGTIAIGGIDFSFEVDNVNGRPAAWQPHLHLIVAGCTKLELRKALQGLYPPSKTVPRPVLIRSVTDLPEVASYCFKSFHWQRCRYNSSSGQPRTRLIGLKPPEQREIALLTADLRHSDMRLFLGIRQFGRELKLLSTKKCR